MNRWLMEFLADDRLRSDPQRLVEVLLSITTMD
jgi:hypothetical protein